MMRQLVAWLIGAVAVLLIQNFATGSNVLPDPVKASLIVSVDTITRSEPFTAGVVLKIDPHWHVYWKSSGDAGLPTRVVWKLPEGWTAGELEWPVPEKFIEKGPMTTYGYQDSVMLMTTITPPPDAQGKVTLDAQVDWMVCEETCIPGSARVSVAKTVTPPPLAVRKPAASTSRIERWRSHLPDEIDPSAYRVEIESRPAPDEKNAVQLEVTITSAGSGAGEILDWYPVAVKNRAVKALTVRKSRSGLTASLILKSYSGPLKAGETLESLVIFRDNSGTRRGATVRSMLNPA